jgi:hypothetical protein
MEAVTYFMDYLVPAIEAIIAIMGIVAVYNSAPEKRLRTLAKSAAWLVLFAAIGWGADARVNHRLQYLQNEEAKANEIKNAPENQAVATASATVIANCPNDLAGGGGVWSDTPALSNLQLGYSSNGQFIPKLILFSTHLSLAGKQFSANFVADESKFALPVMLVKDFQKEVNALIVNAVDPQDNTAKMTLTNGTVSLQINSFKWKIDLPPQTNSDFRIFATFTNSPLK